MNMSSIIASVHLPVLAGYSDGDRVTQPHGSQLSSVSVKRDSRVALGVVGGDDESDERVIEKGGGRTFLMDWTRNMRVTKALEEGDATKQGGGGMGRCRR